jgi:hypothetical protein
MCFTGLQPGDSRAGFTGLGGRPHGGPAGLLGRARRGWPRAGASPAPAAILVYGSAFCRGPHHRRVSALVRAALGKVFA